MATKKPIVIGSGGRFQQLQAGDTLGITSETGQVSQTADADLVAGAPVYTSTNDHVAKARANASGTTIVMGLVVADIASAASGMVQTNGFLALTTGQWDVITGGSGGLTAGSTYFLSPTTAGLLTATPPTTTGQFLLIVGEAISTTEMNIRIGEPILL